MQDLTPWFDRMQDLTRWFGRLAADIRTASRGRRSDSRRRERRNKNEDRKPHVR